MKYWQKTIFALGALLAAGILLCSAAPSADTI